MKKNLLITFITAVFGSVLFTLLHIPVAFLLGAMTAVMIGSRLSKIPFYWPAGLRDAGIIIVGYSIGLSFTQEAVLLILQKLPFILLVTVCMILFSAISALIIAKLTGIDYPTVLIGSIPGGLSQMILLAEEVKGINITVVTFMQVARLTMIIFIVPVLVFGPWLNAPSGPGFEAAEPFWKDLFPSILLFAFVSFIGIILSKRLKLPTPYLLGPIMGTAALVISGVNGPELPTAVLDISQLLIGAHIGMMMKPEKLSNKTKTMSLAALSALLLIAGSVILSFLIMHLFHFSPATSFLSLAPGGMDQMAIIAHETGANLAIVTGYQLFRLFFIFFVVPPFLKWIFFKYKKLESSN
ncbi:AbrB family transcriptional regulator [Sporosarcina globispora]|uniref:AbrB family transcriptional regulator n=1 Tax=Sporosarcina globispora TaxID=1459 RepID=A0A0M0GG11_SPOGL|nr:AbrB family transcriptional regulator [Sporosarcina globispora]KON88371.1 AbrB family transcriptional regulator [Sporosarcina globispora]